MAPKGTKSQDVCGLHALEIQPFSAPERQSARDLNSLWKSFEDLGVSRISGPVSPCYATYNSRLKTFQNWTKGHIQSPEKLAEAGFHYTQVNDYVLCFHCGGGLKNWEVDDDPWVEHAYWFCKCGFVVLQKGTQFIKNVQAKAKVTLANQNKTETPAKGTEEKQEEHETEKVTSETSPSPSSTTTTSTQEVQSEPSKLQNPDLEDRTLCRICCTNEREIVFLPCGHFLSCAQCAPSLNSCALCRKPFQAIVRAYLS